MSDFGKDRLADYVEVKDRIKLFYAAYPDGALVTASAEMVLDADGVVRVWCKALAYRNAEDPHPGTGWSYLAVPGKTPYTNGSEIENAETSAWGRAIGSLGIGIEKSIATKNEIQTKESAEPKVTVPNDDGSLIGTVEVGDKASSDFLLRQTPAGSALGFRLRAQGGVLVECIGPLADQLFHFRDVVIGKRVSVWGTLGTRSFTSNKGKPNEREVTYQVLAATRVRVPEIGDLPTEPTPEAPSADLPWDLEAVDLAEGRA